MTERYSADASSRPQSSRPRLQPRIVAVDDDPTTRIFLREALSALDASLRLAADAASFRALRAEAVPDLSIIDVELPDGTGHALAREVGLAGEPMVFFSVHDDPRYRLRALEAGALDYLSKSIEPREFMLRIANLLAKTRRSARPATAVARRFAGLRFDPQRRRLEHGDGDEVRLTASEALVMQALTDVPHQTVTREALSGRIGRSNPARDRRTVDVLIYRLRRKLAAASADPGIIATVPSEGYALIETVLYE